MSGLSDLAKSLHLRHNPKSIRNFTTRALSENKPGRRSGSVKQVSGLLDVWKHLPEEERKTYSRIAILHEQNMDRFSQDLSLDPVPFHSRGHDPAAATVNCENSRPHLPLPKAVGKGTHRTRTVVQESSDSSAYVSDEPARTVDKRFIGEMNEVVFSHPLLPQTGSKLFIGDIRSANDLSQIQKHKIYSILTFGKANSPSNFPFVRAGYLTIPLEDKETGSVIAKLHAISQFIDAKLQKGNVLIHCYFGVSRSCAAVIAYLMKRYKMTLQDAKNLVQKARPCMSLSPWFEHQLRQYENVYVLPS